MVTQTEATVTWDASVDGGNLPIERYYVQWFNTMEGVWREAGVEANGELVYMITGLETYMVYSVRVFANNGKYNGTVAVMNLTSGEDSEYTHTHTHNTHTQHTVTHRNTLSNTHYLSEMKRGREATECCAEHQGPGCTPDDLSANQWNGLLSPQLQ